MLALAARWPASRSRRARSSAAPTPTAWPRSACSWRLVAFSAVIFAAPLDSPSLFRVGTVLIGFGGGLFAVGTLTAAMALAPRGQAASRSAPGARCRRRRPASRSPRRRAPRRRVGLAAQGALGAALRPRHRLHRRLPHRNRAAVRHACCDRPARAAAQRTRAAAQTSSVSPNSLASPQCGGRHGKTGAITGYIDVAQIVLYAFWLFFVGLIFYLRREDKREGYPLEADRAGRVRRRRAFRHFPGPRRSCTLHGTASPYRAVATTAPNHRCAPVGGVARRAAPADRQPDARRRRARQPMPIATTSGTQPIEGMRIVPLRVAPSVHRRARIPTRAGCRSSRADREVAGTVRDVWVDRAESDPLSRGRDDGVAGARAAADDHGATSNATRGAGDGAIDLRARSSPTCRRSKPRPGHHARGGQDRSLLRRRHTLRHAGAWEPLL